jgi:hypothetical protein
MISTKDLEVSKAKFILFIREYYKKVQNVLPIKNQELEAYRKAEQYIRDRNITGLLTYIHSERKETDTYQ